MYVSRFIDVRRNGLPFHGSLMPQLMVPRAPETETIIKSEAEIEIRNRGHSERYPFEVLVTRKRNHPFLIDREVHEAEDPKFARKGRASCSRQRKRHPPQGRQQEVSKAIIAVPAEVVSFRRSARGGRA